MSGVQRSNMSRIASRIPAVTKIHGDRVTRVIVLVRGLRVLLDRDLAALYDVETRVLNQAVRRNIVRFPPDFMLRLTREEIRDISQIVTCSTIKHARSVSAFTEQGVAMLSSVLNSERAITVNIAIMRAFVRLRETVALHKDLVIKLAELERKIEGHDASIQTLFEAMRQLMAPQTKPPRSIGFRVEEARTVYGAASKRRRIVLPR
jgi:hypothetical protein